MLMLSILPAWWTGCRSCWASTQEQRLRNSAPFFWSAIWANTMSQRVQTPPSEMPDRLVWLVFLPNNFLFTTVHWRLRVSRTWVWLWPCFRRRVVLYSFYLPTSQTFPLRRSIEKKVILESSRVCLYHRGGDNTGCEKDVSIISTSVQQQMRRFTGLVSSFFFLQRGRVRRKRVPPFRGAQKRGWPWSWPGTWAGSPAESPTTAAWTATTLRGSQ